MNRESRVSLSVVIAIAIWFAFGMAQKPAPLTGEVVSKGASSQDKDALTDTEAVRFIKLSGRQEMVAEMRREAEARLRVVGELEKKLLEDMQAFEAAALRERGYKPGEARFNLATGRVELLPKPDPPKVPAAPK
jgi:hypothetical protein